MMSKDPAFLFYPGDWQGGTSTFTRFIKGCYLDVLIAQFNSGHLSLEEIKTVLGSDFGQSWPTLQKKFAVDKAGKYFNERLELEKNKRAAFTASRRKNLESSHMIEHMKPRMQSHMDNINRDADVFKNKKEWQESVTNELFADEWFITDLTINHKGKDLRKAFDDCFRHHCNAKNPPSEIGEWKQKLNTWLINDKTNGQRNTIKGPDRTTDAVIESGKQFGAEAGF